MHDYTVKPFPYSESKQLLVNTNSVGLQCYAGDNLYLFKYKTSIQSKWSSITSGIHLAA